MTTGARMKAQRKLLGIPILAEENIEEYVNCPKSIRADFALTCKGDSMINARIFDGDVVYIRQQKTVNNGEIAAVMIEGEATLKRVRLFQDHIVLEPETRSTSLSSTGMMKCRACKSLARPLPLLVRSDK